VRFDTSTRNERGSDREMKRREILLGATETAGCGGNRSRVFVAHLSFLYRSLSHLSIAV